ncbi:hypothetical protein HYT55_01075 [Candidatus Woesearchaeota archaeon]|nr:hypothetical protein [Candidatus Woesearchaeota archaeon]
MDHYIPIDPRKSRTRQTLPYPIQELTEHVPILPFGIQTIAPTTYHFTLTALHTVRRGILDTLQKRYAFAQESDREYHFNGVTVTVDYQAVNPLFAVGMGFAPRVEVITLTLKDTHLQRVAELADFVTKYFHDSKVSFGFTRGDK